MKHEPWKSMALPHLAFHAWGRSPKAKFEVPQYRKPKSNEWSLKSLHEVSWKTDLWHSLVFIYSKLIMKIKIERQEYRHVDNVLFEHNSIGEGFINVSIFKKSIDVLIFF